MCSAALLSHYHSHFNFGKLLSGVNVVHVLWTTLPQNRKDAGCFSSHWGWYAAKQAWSISRKHSIGAHNSIKATSQTLSKFKSTISHQHPIKVNPQIHLETCSLTKTTSWGWIHFVRTWFPCQPIYWGVFKLCLLVRGMSSALCLYSCHCWQLWDMNKVASLILNASAVTSPNTKKKSWTSVFMFVCVSIQKAVYRVGDYDLVMSSSC